MTASPENGSGLAKLLNMFIIPRKKELVRYCNSLVIKSEDFAKLVMAAELGLLIFDHRIHQRSIVPDHLNLTPVDLSVMSSSNLGPLRSGVQRTLRKMMQIFKDHRFLVGHLFVTRDMSQWYFFYFDQRDFSSRGNHWKHGSHIHLLSHLWAKQSVEELWVDFIRGNPKVSDSIHIRWMEEQRSHPRHV